MFGLFRASCWYCLHNCHLYGLASENYQLNQYFWVTRIIYIWTATLISVGLFNLLAFIQVTRLQRARRSSVRNGEQPNFVQQSIDQILIRIQKATVAIIAIDVALIVCLCTGLTSFIRTIYSDPNCFLEPSAVAFRFTPFLWYLLFAVALWFVAPSFLGTPPSRSNDENANEPNTIPSSEHGSSIFQNQAFSSGDVTLS